MFDCRPVERAQIIGVLRLHDLAEVRFHQRGAVLECALQIRHGAQKLNLVRRDFAFPCRAQLDQMLADILEFLDLGLQTVDPLVDPAGSRIQFPGTRVDLRAQFRIARPARNA